MSDPDQEQARRLIRAAMIDTGLGLTRLAREAGVSHTTLTRFMNDPTVKHVLSNRTTNKIAAAAARIRLARAAALSIEPAPLPRRSSPPLKRGARR